MPSVSLASYTLRIRGKRTSEFERFDQVWGKSNLLQVLRNFFDDLSAGHKYDAGTRSLHSVSDVESDDRSIWGYLKIGEHGYSAELVDVDAMVQRHARKPNEAELLPFYFLISVPPGETRGIIVLQRHGSQGIRTTLTTILREYLSQRFPDHLVAINPHVPAAVMQQLLEGGLKKITLIKHTVPKDIADSVSMGGQAEQEGDVVIQIKAKRNKYLRKPDWLTSSNGVLQIGRDLGELGDRVSVSVVYAGKERKIDFHRPESIAPYIDVTADLEFGDDGHPTPASIHAVARELCVNLEKEIQRRS